MYHEILPQILIQPAVLDGVSVDQRLIKLQDRFQILVSTGDGTFVKIGGRATAARSFSPALTA